MFIGCPGLWKGVGERRKAAAGFEPVLLQTGHLQLMYNYNVHVSIK